MAITATGSVAEIRAPNSKASNRARPTNRCISVPTIAVDSSTPRRGLFPDPCPTEKAFRNGNTRSLARDWRIRGAPRYDARADDSVAAMTPMSMKAGTEETVPKIPVSSMSSRLVALAARSTATET